MGAERTKVVLNNYCQSLFGKSNQVTYETENLGPAHAPSWKSVCYVQGIERGRAEGMNCKARAEDAAAQLALDDLSTNGA